MKNLHDPARATEVKQRLALLRPDTPTLWGTMNAPQAVAHMAVALESGLGDRAVPRVFIGRLIGRFFKGRMLGNDAPLPKNSPTAPEFIIADQRDLDRERERLIALVDRVATGGPAACTTHPHAFFGRMTPEEWGVLMYKHTDHHLRQFGV